jgi:hypothetical protein
MPKCKQCGDGNGKYKILSIFGVLGAMGATLISNTFEGLLAFFGLGQPALCGERCKAEYYAQRPIAKKVQLIWTLICWSPFIGFVLFLIFAVIFGPQSPKVHH